MFRLLFLLWALPCWSLSALIVVAHPDDEVVFAGTIYAMTHELGATVDEMVITNGEGGYRYSGLAESIYGVELTNGEVGRAALPAIRKREVTRGGEILGIRNYIFCDQLDWRYTRDPAEAYSIWDIELIEEMLDVIGDYDLVLTMLPTDTTHGHHQAATWLALAAVERLERQDRPLILATQLAEEEPLQFGHRMVQPTPIFRFDREAPATPSGLNYHIPINWMIAEHKSQGTLQKLMNWKRYEDFYLFDANHPATIGELRQRLDSLEAITFP
jgi:N-acetylglucosamine malate deacetylase 2